MTGLAVVLLALSGCTALPSAGPNDAAVHRQAMMAYPAQQAPLLDYVVIDLTRDVLAYFPPDPVQSLREGFGATNTAMPTIPLGIGDIVEVSIFESSSGGLFIPEEAGSRAGNFVTLPRQTIDSSGTITIPYAGSVPAAGRTVTQVQDEIEARLADRAIEPQAVITLVESRSSEISVLGDVETPARLEVNPGGERVLDVISRAGGLSSPGSETYISLQRNGTSATVLFDSLIENPSENIFVYPGDTLFAKRERRTYLAFGASGLNGRIDFEESNLMLAEALAQAGGLLDSRADPGQVFVYRRVDSALLAEMGVAVSAKSGADYPVIFRMNMRDPAGYFIAQRFPMRDKDILYASNSDSVELIKFLNLVTSVSNGVTTPIIDAASVKNAF